MTPEESIQVDEARRNYFNKCQDFKEEVTDFFKHFKPKHVNYYDLSC